MMGMDRKGHRVIAKGTRIAAIDHPLASGKRHCARCQDTGSVWMVCPDAGAVRVPCDCGCGEPEFARGLSIAEIGAAAVVAGGCAALLLLI